MKITAIVFWVLSLLCLLATTLFTATSISSGAVGGSVSTEIIPFFKGMTMVGAFLFFSIFTFFIAGCVFWAGSLVSSRKAP